MAAIFFSNKYRDAKIISIEPETSNFLLLEENTKHYDNITPINKALSNISNQELYVVDRGYGNSGFMTESIEKSGNKDSESSVKALTVDEEKDMKVEEGAEEEVGKEEANVFRGLVARLNFISQDCPDLQFR